jgi:hypothetical protein
MIITLETWEYEHATHIGTRRYTANWTKQNATYYKQNHMEDDRTATVAAAITELAVAKATNRYWHAHIWHHTEHQKHKHLPDVGTNIEVRRIRDPQKQKVALRQKQLGKNLILFAGHPHPPEFRQVEIWGWINHDEGWELADPWEGNETVRYLHRKHLTPLTSPHSDKSN